MIGSTGSTGVILLLWNAAFWQKIDEKVGKFSISILLNDVRSNVEWVATSVYGPHNASEKSRVLDGTYAGGRYM